MIPKKIHYCWLSEDALPHKIKRCIDSWHKYLPDYEIILWDFNRFPKGSSKWVDEAFSMKKFAFAADYIRAYALYNEGGIYLDSDVEVIKSFNPLLELPYFLGTESEGPIEAAAMGASKGHPLFEMLLNYYDHKSFRQTNGMIEDTPMPNIINSLIETNFTKNHIDSINQFIFDEKIINIFTSDYFSPKSYVDETLHLTQNTFCIHHFAGSWLPLSTRIKIKREFVIRKLQSSFGNQTISNFKKLYHFLTNNK